MEEEKKIVFKTRKPVGNALVCPVLHLRIISPIFFSSLLQELSIRVPRSFENVSFKGHT